jgi:hypothetical protein
MYDGKIVGCGSFSCCELTKLELKPWKAIDSLGRIR